MKGFTKYLLLGALTALPTICFTEMAMAAVPYPSCCTLCAGTTTLRNCYAACNGECTNSDGSENAVTAKCKEACDINKKAEVEPA